jgi:hypothetical protein
MGINMTERKRIKFYTSKPAYSLDTDEEIGTLNIILEGTLSSEWGQSFLMDVDVIGGNMVYHPDHAPKDK